MADVLSFSTSSSSPSYDFTKNLNFQLIQCIILHDLTLLCSFIISHPLYSSYFVFFSPYLIRFISFISPLFIATIVLSVLLTTTTAFCHNLPQSELEIVQTVLNELKSNLNDVRANDGECNFEDFEVYKIVFGCGNEDDDRLESSENSVHGGRRNDVTTGDSDKLDKLIEELDRFEDFSPPIETNLDELRQEEVDPVKKVSSIESCEVIDNAGSDGVVRVDKSSSWRLNSSRSFGSHGWMREEKEWRKTLACKLFEERHNSGREEGMDSLWEAYENDNLKNRKEITTKNNNNKNMTMTTKNSNNGGIKSFDDDEDEDDEEEEMSNGHLCCLQALKFSTGKMNLGMGMGMGMGKPNLVKISKAFKGFGWLHHVGSKNGKKRLVF